MTDQAIFIFAVVVFCLMVIGLVLTILEFRASEAEISGNRSSRPPRSPQ